MNLADMYRWAGQRQVRVSRVIPLIVAGLLLLGTQLESGFGTYQPGPVPEVQVAGQVLAGGPSRGEWRFTTVKVTPLSVNRYLWSHLRGEPLIRLIGDDHDHLQSRGATQMLLSKEVAWAVATDIAAGGSGHVGGQVVVSGIEHDGPADHTELQPGDIIVAIDGKAIDLAEQVPSRIAESLAGEVVLSIERRGEPHVVNIDPDRSTGTTRIGVSIADRPVAADSLHTQPDIDASGVGGPSAGLLFTLAYLDILTDGDLTAGMVVTGSGTIEADGTVGRVDGVALKVEGALAEGASVFLAPSANAQEAAVAADGRIEVVPISTIVDAVRWLCSAGGQTSACR